MIRGLAAILAVQAALVLIAASASSYAVLVCAVVGILALGRYAAVSLFASCVCAHRERRAKVFAVATWVLFFVALGAVIAAVGVKAGDLLPWAAASACAGPIVLSMLALGSGIGELAAGGRR
jgi:accessory gene regulator protein AgrB